MRNLFILLFLAFSIQINAQTLIAGGAAGNGNFETGTTGWVLVNGTQTNKWVTGAEVAGTDGNSIYISSSATTPYAHQYSTSAASYSYFYKDVSIPAGTKTFWIVFDYLVNGQATTDQFGTTANDALRIWARNPSSAVTAGQELNGVVIGASAGYYNQGTWQRKIVRYLDATGYAGSTLRVVFQWFNDNSGGTQPPAALDNIEMYTSCQEFVFPSQNTSAMSGTSAQISWYTVTGATGYEIRYRKINDPLTVPTYTTPVSLSGGSVFSYTLTGLSPSSTYLVEVRPTGTGCTDYSPHANITTLNAPVNDDCSGAIPVTVQSNECTGMLSGFAGANTSTAPSSACSYISNMDVWFSFTAQNAQQYIQTMADPGNSTHTAKSISLYSGTCGSLQLLAQPCATESYSAVNQDVVTRLAANGLTPGTTYYVRVNSSSTGSGSAFRICIYNNPALPDCPVQLQPASGAQLNFGIPARFLWRKANNAAAYKLQIIEQSGAYTEVYTTDTSYYFSPSAGINYTWKLIPLNVADQPPVAACSALPFTTCAAQSNPVTLSLTTSTKCANDSIKITLAPAGNSVQWFVDGQLISGATADSIWAKLPGSYTVRVLNGNCYSNPSSSVTVSNLPTPVKPVLNISGPLSFCDGGSVLLSVSFNVNNSWYRNGTAINGANSTSYTASQSGSYYVRMTNTSSGCSSYSDTAAVTAIQSPTPVVTASGPLTFCAGDSVTLHSSTASGNQWYKNGTLVAGATSQEIVVKQSGGYTVMATNTGCTSQASGVSTITVNAVPNPLTISSGGSFICNGDSALLQASTAAGYQWLLNNNIISGATNQSFYAKTEGAYSVKAVQSNCLSTASTPVNIVVGTLPAKPVITAVANVLSTASGYAEYRWYFNNTLIPNASTFQYTALQNGNYKVEVAGSNGCRSASDNFTFAAAAITELNLNGTLIRFYPNPVRDVLTVQVATGRVVSAPLAARLIDPGGRALRDVVLKKGSNQIDLKGLPAGSYILILKEGNLEKPVRIIKLK